MGDRIDYKFVSAVREGRLEEIRELINYFSLSYSQAWSKGYLLLRYALEEGHTEIAKLLLAHDSEVNSNSEELSDTPLHYAIKNADIEIVEILLDRGAIINAKNHYHSTPLHIAVEGEKIDTMKLLLSRNARVNAKKKDGMTALHIAAKGGNLQIVEHLLIHGANINLEYMSTSRENYIVYTPLLLAIEAGHKDIVKLLLECGAEVNLNMAVDIAIKKGHEKVSKILLEWGAMKSNKYGEIMLHFVEEGRSKIIEHMSKHYPDVNYKSDRRALIIAMLDNKPENREIIKNLLRYGFTPIPEDVNNSKLLDVAVATGYLKIVEELLKYGADVNMLYKSKLVRCYTCLLHVAIINEQKEVAELLIRYGADVNAQDQNGKTPIIYAIERKNTNLDIIKLLLNNNANIKDHPELLSNAVKGTKKQCREIIEILLQHGADINGKDKYGRTALHFTALDKNEKLFHNYKRNNTHNIDHNIKDKFKANIAKLLLNRGANVNAKTKDGVTTLLYASQKEYVKVVDALLAYNADVNSTFFKTGVTSLHLFAEQGNKVMCEKLLNKRANINATQKDGTTALHIAVERNHVKIAGLLLNRGANVDCKLVKSNLTPLHIAAEKNSQLMAEVLLKFGADIDSKDEYGRTALYLAATYGHYKIVKILLQYGPDINTKSFSISLFDTVSNCSCNNHHFCLVCRNKVVVKNLAKYMIMIKTAKLHLSTENLLFINSFSDDEINCFQVICQEEITSMKNEKVYNNVSFYDILTKDINQLASYARNESIIQVFRSDEYKIKFLRYGNMIHSRFRKGERRKELLAQGNLINKIFYFFFSNFRLPQECTKEIFNYLSNGELRILMDAF